MSYSDSPSKQVPLLAIHSGGHAPSLTHKSDWTRDVRQVKKLLDEWHFILFYTMISISKLEKCNDGKCCQRRDVEIKNPYDTYPGFHGCREVDVGEDGPAVVVLERHAAQHQNRRRKVLHVRKPQNHFGLFLDRFYFGSKMRWYQETLSKIAVLSHFPALFIFSATFWGNKNSLWI